ncbi:hypothetical protein BUE80_DR001882 [Diplocarpon rosae]|nr:hypothetical protein BUE80_DR001882 [Diplocarpon rosae]
MFKRYPDPGQQKWYVDQEDNRPEASMTSISHLSGAQRASEYSWRAPSPPHIWVPQPREANEINIPGFQDLGYTSDDHAILTSVTANTPLLNRSQEWKYTARRSAQNILPYLQLGPSSASRDLETLKKDGVTLLLVIRNTASAAASLLSGDKSAATLGIQSAAVDVGGNGELIAALPRGIRIINDHLLSQYRKYTAIKNDAVPQPCGKILVFCESGNERSAAFVTGYMMHVFGMGLVPAMQYVQSQRFCVAIDDGLKHMLHSYQDILVAQRSLDAPSATFQTLSKSKRRRDEVEDDEDVDMGQGDDEARFGGRTYFTPFQ